MTGIYKHTRKEDLINLLSELGEIVDPDDTVVQLKFKIESSQTFKDDPEMVSDLLNSIVEERKNRALSDANKLELERIKLAQIEKQVELETLRTQNRSESLLANTADSTSTTRQTDDVEKLLKSVRALTVQVPDKAENFNLFFQTMERAFAVKKVPEEFKAEILVNILGEKLNQILYYIDEKDIKSYEKVKNLVLKHYQPTPQECLNNFKRATKEAAETHVQFASRLNALFRYYLKLRNVESFEALVDLMVSDRMYNTLDRDLNSYICIKQGENWFTPLELAKECDIYVVNKGKNHYDMHAGMREKFNENRGRNPNKSPKEHEERRTPFKPKERKITCFVCGGNHFARVCDKKIKVNLKKELQSTNENVKISAISHDREIKNSPYDSLIISELKYVDILLDNTPKTALLDSGSTLLIVNKQSLDTEKTAISKIYLTSCFGESRVAYLTQFQLSLSNCDSLEITAAVCDTLEYDCIIPESLYQLLKQRKQNTVSHRYANSAHQANTDEQGQRSKEAGFFPPESEVESRSVQNTPFQEEISSKRDDNKLEPFLINVCNAVESTRFDLSHISDSALRNKLKDLLNNYVPVKSENTNLQMSLILTDDIPVCQRPRRLSFLEKQEVERQITEWLKEGIIRESCSNYCSPIVVCRKKSGSLRLCCDFRKINRKLIRDRYPLPIIEEVLDKLGNGKVFTTLDLKNAFFHVDIEEKSRKFTSFVTDNGQYEFNKVPFGLSNSPIIFQRYINTVFKELLKDGTLIIYLDDIIIPASNEQEALDKLIRVLETASKFGLELNLKKCQFMKRKIHFLGYVIESGTIQPSPEKTLAVQRFPEPRNAKDVQSFLGLTGFFRKFIEHYATKARPLSDLLRASTPFQFGPEQKLAFQKLKDILSSKPVLRLYRQGAPLELHTDASKLGFGAVLLQQGEDEKFYPIHYMSKKTSVQEEKLCAYELEVMAVIEALKKFRNYLLGNKFKIFTDCEAFTKTMDKKELTPKIARWALYLQEFEYELKHRPGKQMKHVDALSRHPVMSVTHDEITHKIIRAQANDEYVKTIKQLLKDEQTSEYVLKNEVLYKTVNDQDLLVVPDAMTIEVVKKCHAFGHFSISKTEDLVKREFYFTNMRKCVETVVNNCIECILINKKRGKGEGFLNPIPKEDTPLSTYHIDFLGPMPTTNKNYNHIFTVVDAYSKFVWLYPVKSTSAEDALQKLRQQQTIFGNPMRFISDKGPAFTSKEFKEYCEIEGIDHAPITTGIPRGNGQVERIHSTVISVLSKLSIAEPNKWYKYVEAVQRILNSTVSRSTKKTPFELMTGLKMRNKEEKRILEILEEERENARMEDLQLIREEAKRNILKIQEENKKSYDKKRKKARKYKEGDLVAIQRTQFGSGMKLRPKFLGPYEVVKVKPNDRYDVRKIGDHEGPNNTSTAADHMKLWC